MEGEEEVGEWSTLSLNRYFYYDQSTFQLRPPFKKSVFPVGVQRLALILASRMAS